MKRQARPLGHLCRPRPAPSVLRPATDVIGHREAGLPSPSPPEVALETLRADLRLRGADGAASEDTRRCYLVHARRWLAWCAASDINPVHAREVDQFDYRAELVETGRARSTIALRLAVLRRLYAALQADGLRRDNPAAHVRAPRTQTSGDDFPVLSEAELRLRRTSVGCNDCWDTPTCGLRPATSMLRPPPWPPRSGWRYDETERPRRRERADDIATPLGRYHRR